MISCKQGLTCVLGSGVLIETFQCSYFFLFPYEGFLGDRLRLFSSTGGYLSVVSLLIMERRGLTILSPFPCFPPPPVLKSYVCHSHHHEL